MLKWVFGIIVIALCWAAVLLLGLPMWIAIATSGAVLGLLLVLFLVRRLRASKGASRLEGALAGQASAMVDGASPAEAAEVAAMHAEFHKAVAALKALEARPQGQGRPRALALVRDHRPARRRQDAPRSRNSGLQFPYLSASGGGVRGVGGTRNCDWWLTNEAILLDTAGRYTTEDDDRDEWLAFLDMLRKYRPRKPINGVIVAVSVGELAEASDEAASSRAGQAAPRAHRRGDGAPRAWCVPVYLLFTKCDLMPGLRRVLRRPAQDRARADLGLHARRSTAERRAAERDASASASTS